MLFGAGWWPISFPNFKTHAISRFCPSKFLTKKPFRSKFTFPFFLIFLSDQIKLDTEINVLRSNLKLKVNRLREKEGRDELRDLGLKALSKDEVAAVRSVIGPAPTWR